MIKVHIPPIKSQGIKSKLVPHIRGIIPENFKGTWIEPFMGTGVVGLNIADKNALLCDSNPHLVAFYKAVQEEWVTSQSVRDYLNVEGQRLQETGESHYYAIRDRFNANGNPFDFLFVNRAGFNGMIRFNRKGRFNIPFCRKQARFSPAYITKICNQIEWVSKLLRTKNLSFKHQDFTKTITEASSGDLIYCDPPYIDRHADYYNGWTETEERKLHEMLSNFSGRFILSTWHHNQYRKNDYINLLWSNFHITTREHFYHVGGREDNRNPVIEALITNFEVNSEVGGRFEDRPQLGLLSMSGAAA